MAEFSKKDIEKVVEATLEKLGIDVDEVHEAQADFLWVRKQRKGAEELGRWTRRGLVGAAVSGIAWAVWEGLKAAFILKTGG